MPSSGSHDRRGFDALIQFSMGLLPCGILLMVCYSWVAGLALGLAACMAIITLIAVSARPDNNPSTFFKWSRSRDRRRPILLCIGDSLTHGNASASYTPEIPLKLTQKLGLPLADYGSTFSDPLWVVNAGQNHITSHTVLHERIGPALNIFPDFVFIMIGTNDVRAMYNKAWRKSVMSVNKLPEAPTLEVLQKNITGIIDYILETSPMAQIGISTLPPMGENLKSKANVLVRKTNKVIESVAAKAGDHVTLLPFFDELENVIEKERRGWSLPVDYHLLATVVQLPIYHISAMTTWELLAKPFGFSVLSDGLHLNERGAGFLVDLIVDWLGRKNIAKAIAVKR